MWTEADKGEEDKNHQIFADVLYGRPLNSFFKQTIGKISPIHFHLQKPH